MQNTHPLLQRQIKRYVESKAQVPDEWDKFLEVVNQAYWDSDNDRVMLERALELSSQELLQANSEMRAMIKAFPDLFLRLDRDGHVLSYKRGDMENLPLKDEQPLGKKFYYLFEENNIVRLKTVFLKVLENQMINQVELALEGSGSKHYYEARIIPMECREIFVIIRDITERKLAEEQLVYYSMFDPLTNLYNRAYFENEMRRMEYFSMNPTGLIICDVDNLKVVNDTYGHDRGDELLKEVARVLRQSMRKNDIIARIGGDEFAILLPDSDAAAVEATCQRVRDTITAYNNAGSGLKLSISMGSAHWKSKIQKLDDVFKEADDNMYKEKFINHIRLNQDLLKNVFDQIGMVELNFQGLYHRLNTLNAQLHLELGRVGSDEYIKLLIHLKKSNQEGDEVCSLEVATEGSANPSEYKSYIRSLVLLLNAALD
ncbi:MAG: diguanylate cyclase [Syntrophomonadaceae bacterium]